MNELRYSMNNLCISYFSLMLMSVEGDAFLYDYLTNYNTVK